MKLAVPLVAALALAACNASGYSNMPSAGTTGTAQTHQVPGGHRACANARMGEAECLVVLDDKFVRLNHGVNPNVQHDVPGLWPIDFQTRYNLPITQGSGQIVAIVDAYDNPN